MVLPDAVEETLFKHDVKAVVPADRLPEVTAGSSIDTTIQQESLSGTADRAERMRPSDEKLLLLVEAGEPVSLIARDGEVFRGLIRSFGRWDADVELEGGALVTVMFHALHRSCSFLTAE